jgi:hypothetical protein
LAGCDDFEPFEIPEQEPREADARAEGGGQAELAVGVAASLAPMKTLVNR